MATITNISGSDLQIESLGLFLPPGGTEEFIPRMFIAARLYRAKEELQSLLTAGDIEIDNSGTLLTAATVGKWVANFPADELPDIAGVSGSNIIKIGASRRTSVPANAALFLSHFENQLLHTNVPLTFERDGTITDITVAFNRTDVDTAYDVQLYRDARNNNPTFQATLATVPPGVEELAVNGLSESVLAAEQYALAVVRNPSASPTITRNTGNLNDGVAVGDGDTGIAYLMFSNQNLFNRFSADPPYDDTFGQNALRVICVRQIGGSGTAWEYSDNFTWFPFTPVGSDVLLAQVDLTADTVTSLEGTNTTIGGIQAGYSSGDLAYQANVWAGLSGTVFSDGEFYVTGSTFEAFVTASNSQFNREVVYLTVEF